jgi:hypothetical protein
MRAFLAAISSGAAAAAAVLWLAEPARADGAWIEINPSTIQAGYRVGIRASCEENLNQATVKSDAFGEVILAPVNGFLIGDVTIPSNKRARTYSVKLTCANESTATTSLTVVGMDRPTKGPNTGFGGTASSGGETLVLAGGVATVAAGVGLGVLALRRRRASV